MKPFQFIGPAASGRSDNYSAQRLVNYYIDVGAGKAAGQLIGCPGRALEFTLTGTGCRGFYKVSDTVCIMVCGGFVYSVSDTYAATQIGTVADDYAMVSIACNGDDVLVASGGVLYSMSLSGSVSTVIASDVGSVDSLDDYFVATKTTSNTYIWSDYQTATFDPLSFKADNSANDLLMGVKVARRTMYVLGTKSVRAWYDSGTSADIPFSRIDGSVFEVGCIAKHSIAEMDSVFFLGGDDKGAGAVWMIAGGSPMRISTPAIEYAIAQWPDKSDAEAFTYTDEGHAFYVLSSTSGDETWVFDVATKEWHQRAYLNSTGQLCRIKPRCHVHFAGKHLVGDYDSGAVCEYSLDVYADNGDPLPAIRACETIQAGLSVQPTTTLELDMDIGYGLNTGQGVNPQAMLRCSRDGGKTWGNSLWASFGRMGEYSARCRWNRVGGGRRMVLR
ncbi:MAG: hypothetical protein IPO08_21430 [Xanthomonadales bacterium]|nr:hypothetical protein [Xanthomonadales bacterium]